MAVPSPFTADGWGTELTWPDAAVRLWHVPLDLDRAALFAAALLLTDEERAHADRGRPEVRRRRIALRAGLRRALGEVLDQAPDSVPLTRSATGRPTVAATSAVDANCSASDDVGLVAVSPHGPVGIDVERAAPWYPEVVDEGWLSQPESVALAALPDGSRDLATTRCWTKKEALLKGTGAGLTADLTRIVTCIDDDAEEIGDWSLSPVPVPNGYAATLAVGTPTSSAHLREEFR